MAPSAGNLDGLRLRELLDKVDEALAAAADGDTEY